jgi:hypothetical protein
MLGYWGELTATERKDWAALTGHFQEPLALQQPQRKLFELPAEPLPERVTVDVRGVRVEGARDFGEVWLALVLWRKLGLDRLLAELLPAGQEEIDWATIVTWLVVARFCAPSRELQIAETWYRGTALEDLLGVPIEKVNPERLYRAPDRALPLKSDFEKHVRGRLGELFPLKFDLLL